MLFENILGLRDLPGTPAFRSFVLNDYNPVSGQCKRRLLQDPNEAMRILHRRFLLWLRSRWVPLPNATAVQQHASPLKNVRRHQGNRYFYLLDMQDAYHYVNGKKLAEVVCGFDRRLREQRDEVHTFLTSYFMTSATGGLIVGAPASPELYNHYAGVLLDRNLQDLCGRYGLTYTRYLDDLTLSSHSESIGQRKRSKIRQVIEAAGFSLNHTKSKVCDLQQHAIVVTGVGLQWPGKTFLPRGYLRRLRGLLHHAVKTGDISLAKINGMMSVFWAATDRSNLNATEQKLVQQYRATIQALRT